LLIPGNPRASTLTALVGLAGSMGVVVIACQSPESYHKHGDAGLTAGSGGATFGAGGATFGSGGVAADGTGGDAVGSGGATSAPGGHQATGGAPDAEGGAPGEGGARASGGTGAPGGATAAGGATGAATGGAGTAGRGAATGGAGGAGGGGTGEGGATSMTCPTCTLTVTYLPIGTADGKSIAAEVHVATTTAVPINRITIKYWYTNETGSSDITTDIDYVGLSTGSALAYPSAAGTPTAAVAPPRTNANTVTSITVPETMLLRPGTQLFVKFRIHQSSYTGTFMMANDYSFGAGQTLAMPWTKITAYVGGVRAWGSEPP
jgi:hypothetical protein